MQVVKFQYGVLSVWEHNTGEIFSVYLSISYWACELLFFTAHVYACSPTFLSHIHSWEYPGLSKRFELIQSLFNVFTGS